MKSHYDFSKGKRGAIAPPESDEGKARITIRLDKDVMDFFLEKANATGGTIGYQTLINSALREYMQATSPVFETAVRKIIRDELEAAVRTRKIRPAHSQKGQLRSS
jgi:uncharacterized protein (DUF4415 family)